MTAGAIAPKLFHLAWPLVAGNILQTVYNLTDMFWVGRVSSEAQSAVSLVFPTAWMLISLGLGVTAAATAMVSQHTGAGNHRRADYITGQSMLLALGLSLVLATAGYAIRHPFLHFLGAHQQPGVYGPALDYIKVIFISIPFTFIFLDTRAVLRAVGDTKTAMWLVLTSAGINMLLDPFFILGYGPFPALGTEGAAVATLIARALAAAAGLYVLLGGEYGVRLRLPDLRPDWSVLKRMALIGYPATIDGGMRSFASVAMVALVARFGHAVTAAYGIGIRMMSVTWTVSGAVGRAAATGVGQNLGARQPGRSEEVTWKATGANMALLMALGVACFVFPRPFMDVFSSDPEVISEGILFLRVIALVWAFQGGLMVVQGGFRGAGHNIPAMVLSFMSRWIFRIPVAWVLAWPLAWGARGLWWGMAASGVLAFIVGVFWFRLGRWKAGVIEEEPAAAGD